MPLDRCVSFGTIDAAVDTNFGLGDVEESLPDISLHDRKMQALMDHAADQSFRQTAYGQFDEMLDGSQTFYQAIKPADQLIIDRAAARDVRRLEVVAERGRQELLDSATELVDAVMGSSVGSAGCYANLKNKIYNLFGSGRGSMEKWLNTMAHLDGVLSYDNPLVGSFQQMFARKAAMEADFDSRRRTLLRDMLDDANAANMSTHDFAIAMGHYHTARHAQLEGNDKLLEKWAAEIERLNQEHDALDPSEIDKMKELQERIAKLVDRYDNLEANRGKSLAELTEDEKDHLFTCGYTDRDAELTMQKILSECNISAERADYWASRLSDELFHIAQKRVEAGTVDPDVIKKFPDFKLYAPMLARTALMEKGNLVGPANDATAYNIGSYYERNGRTGLPPDSSYTSLLFYSRKAAFEIGSRDFGIGLDALYNKLQKDNMTSNDHYLHRYNYADFMARRRSVDPEERNIYDQMYRNGGLVVNVPGKDGKFVKQFYTFSNGDFEINGATFNGSELNKAISSAYMPNDASGITRALGKGSSFMGMMYTRFSPLFAPIAGLRDFWERTYNLFNRSYKLPDGEAVSGFNVLPHFLGNIVKSGEVFLRGVRGILDPNSEDGMLYREFVEEGLAQKFTSRYSTRDKTMEELFDTKSPRFVERLGLDKGNLQRWLNSTGDARDRVLDTLDRWNDYFQNAAGFNQYYTLRKLGVSRNVAARGTLREMNLGQRGQLAPQLQALAPFVPPTSQSGIAMLRSLGFGADRIRDIPKEGWKGVVALIAAYGATSLLMPLSKDSLGEDENGVPVYDGFSLDELSRSIPIGIGNGEYVKFPLGFCFPQMGALLANGFDRVSRGQMTLPDLTLQTMYSGLKNLSPLWPDFLPTDSPAMSALYLATPQVLKPLLEGTANMNFSGSPIYREPSNDWESKAASGYLTTPRIYHRMANVLNESVGIDYQPEFYKHELRQYCAGPFRTLTTVAAAIDDIYKHGDKPASLDELHPIAAALGLTYMMGVQANPARNMYSEAKRTFDERIRREGIKLTGPGSRDDPLGFIRRQLTEAGWSPQDVDDEVNIHATETELKKQGQTFNSGWRQLWNNMDTSDDLKSALKGLVDDNEATIVNCVNSLNFYRSR